MSFQMFNRLHLWPSVSPWEASKVGINLFEPLLWTSTSTVLSALPAANYLVLTILLTRDLYYRCLQRTGTINPREKMTCLSYTFVRLPSRAKVSLLPIIVG